MKPSIFAFALWAAISASLFHHQNPFLAVCYSWLAGIAFMLAFACKGFFTTDPGDDDEHN